MTRAEVAVEAAKVTEELFRREPYSKYTGDRDTYRRVYWRNLYTLGQKQGYEAEEMQAWAGRESGV